MARIKKEAIVLISKMLEALHGYGADIYSKAGKVVIEIPFNSAETAKDLVKMILDARQEYMKKGV